MSESSPGIGATRPPKPAMPDQAHSNAPRRNRRTSGNPKRNGQEVVSATLQAAASSVAPMPQNHFQPSRFPVQGSSLLLLSVRLILNIDIIEAHEQWNQVKNLSDVIGLLKLIQQAVITKNTRKHKIHAYFDALHNFYTFYQSSNMSHS